VSLGRRLRLRIFTLAAEARHFDAEHLYSILVEARSDSREVAGLFLGLVAATQFLRLDVMELEAIALRDSLGLRLDWTENLPPRG